MEIKLNDYHKKVNAEMRAKVTVICSSSIPSSSNLIPAASKPTTVFRQGQSDHNAIVAYFGIYNPLFPVLDNFLMAKLLKIV